MSRAASPRSSATNGLRRPAGNNLHRNVIFRDAKDKADQVLPLSQYDSFDPEDLWKWMADYEKKTGGRLLAIPHNGNLSNGLMFDDVTLTTKKAFDRNYAVRRSKWEPLYEVTQGKGTSEAHPQVSPNDELANFEIWDRGSFGPQPKTKDMLPREYTREAFKRGLAYEASLGVNPFKFGTIGSSPPDRLNCHRHWLIVEMHKRSFQKWRSPHQFYFLKEGRNPWCLFQILKGLSPYFDLDMSLLLFEVLYP